MKEEENKILKQIGRHDGLTVPPGYFDDFAARMAASLPKTEFEESATPAAILKSRTFWQKVRPYVYMAAMFAGVWCMMKLFSMLSTSADPRTSAIMAEAMDNEVFVDEYIIDDIDDRYLMEQMYEDGVDLSAFSATFDEEAAPEGFYEEDGYDGENADQPSINE